MPSLDHMDAKTFAAVQKEVYRRTGIHIGERKKTLVMGRLRRQARHQGFDNYPAYMEAVSQASDNDETAKTFVNAVTTNKTSFFRTLSLWEYFLTKYLPDQTPNKTQRWWSGASSSGQEAASMGVLLEHYRQAHAPGMRYSIFASDIAPAMVEAASAQRFPRAQLVSARAPGGIRTTTHFVQDGDAMELDKNIRRNMHFKRHSLFDRLPGQRFDVVFVRNVIIYFTPEDKKRVLDRAIDSLTKNGLFVAGESESPLQHTSRLEFVAPCIYRRKA